MRNQPACSVLQHEFGFVDLKIKLNNDHNYNINNKKKNYNNIFYYYCYYYIKKYSNDNNNNNNN